MPTQTPEQDPAEALLKLALENPEVPAIYFNGFHNFGSNSDMTTVLVRAGRPVAVLHSAYEVAKELAAKLGTAVAGVEQTAGVKFKTSEEIGRAAMDAMAAKQKQ